MSLTTRRITNKIAQISFFLATTITTLTTVLIILFIFIQAIRPFLANNNYGSYPVINFIIGDSWRPRIEIFGIGYMIISTIVATIYSVLIGTVVSLGVAAFFVECLPKCLRNILHFFIECLATIPSVFYGIFSILIIVPVIREISPYPQGESLLSVIIVLAIMILPTICLITIDALEKVDIKHKEGSYALGASTRQTIIFVMFPVAKKGILTGISLGITRAIGETMAVSLVAGNRESGFVRSPFETVRLLTTNIALEQSYATGIHAQLLFSTAFTLLLIIFIINVILQKIINGAK